jgi:hypothetical protein
VPVLRFARDQRGYESTYLVESTRDRGAGPSLLYWFRTPPHVKVGRSAFDEDAIRLLEEQHPEIDFDWDRILAARPPALPEPRDARYSRAERRPAREGRRDERGKAASAPPRHAEPPLDTTVPDTPPPVTPPHETPPHEGVPVHSTQQTMIVSSVAVPDDTPPRTFVRVFDRVDEAPHQLTEPSAAAPHPLTEPSAAERLLGPEKLTIFRARYAELQARITARGGDPSRVEALREQAERVNPDAWVTEAEVASGLASVDAICAELHKLVGRRRRRRRRGGRGGRTPDGPPLDAETEPAEPEEAPDEPAPDDDPQTTG